MAFLFFHILAFGGWMFGYLWDSFFFAFFFWYILALLLGYLVAYLFVSCLVFCLGDIFTLLFWDVFTFLTIVVAWLAFFSVCSFANLFFLFHWNFLWFIVALFFVFGFAFLFVCCVTFLFF